MAVTRWREDATRDDWGSFVYLRDVQSGRVWSAGSHPVGAEADQEEVSFHEDHAEFIRRDGALTTTMDVLVSSEDDGEVRRVSLANGGKARREIELTSYAELVLTTPQTDTAHPVFAKMFVQTEYLPELQALIATRRPRQPGETPVWVAHYAVLEGEAVAGPDLRDPTAPASSAAATPVGATADALARDPAPLSNTAGTVLDPVFSLRWRVSGSRLAAPRASSFWTLVAPSSRDGVAGPDRPAPRPQCVRPGEDAGLDAGRRCSSATWGSMRGRPPIIQRLAAPLIYADPAVPRVRPTPWCRGAGAAIRTCGRSPFRETCRSCCCGSTTCRGHGPSCGQVLRAHEYWRHQAARG